jgi:Spy/CpxP family protein refolding chaperone
MLVKGQRLMTSAAKLKSRWHATMLLLACGSVMLLPNTPAVGQASEPTPPPRSAPHRYRRITIDDQVKGLTKSLDLTETQQTAVKKILELRQQESLRIWRGTSGSERVSRFRMLQVRTASRIRSVLNDEQKKKYNPLGQRPPQQPDQKSVEDWMKATTPH